MENAEQAIQQLIREGEAAGLSPQEIDSAFQDMPEIMFDGTAEDRAQLLRASFQSIKGGKEEGAA